MHKMKKINKIILTTTPIIYVYLILVFIFQYCGVRFVDLFGKSIDYVDKSGEEFTAYSIEFILTALIMVFLLFIYARAKNYSLKRIYYMLIVLFMKVVIINVI